MQISQTNRINGLVFEDQPALVLSDPNRADIALFVGLVGRRTTALPDWLRGWLETQGWINPAYGRQPIEELLDVPVPIDNWQVFDQLFAWDRRPFTATRDDGTTSLGAAVRSFFAQGGRKCYVVRAGAPLPLAAPRADRLPQLTQLMPGYPIGVRGQAADPPGWHGICHLFGLPDISILCLPDLPEIVAADQPFIVPAMLPPPGPQVFVECATGEIADVGQQAVRQIPAPRCGEDEYHDWARAINMTADLLVRACREVQLVAAVPLPLRGTGAERDLLMFLTGEEQGFLGASPTIPIHGSRMEGIASAFVQLAYPWLRTNGSTNLPEGLESPDGILAGMLARNALSRGSFRNAARLQPTLVYDTYPALSQHQLTALRPDNPVLNVGSHSLVERVSLFGPTPGGIRLLSDVTTSLDESYRPANISRLVAAIVRAARRLGEEMAFEASGERLWAQLRENLNRLMLGLLQVGALRGASQAEAFQVRCDRSTMTQNDIDAGRVIVEIQFDTAAPIERLAVVLALNEGGQVSLVDGIEAAGELQ